MEYLIFYMGLYGVESIYKSFFFYCSFLCTQKNELDSAFFIIFAGLGWGIQVQVLVLHQKIL